MRLNINKTFHIIICSRLSTLSTYFNVENITVRMRSGLGNDIGVQEPKPQPQHMDRHVLAVIPITKPVMIAGVEAMIQVMLAKHTKSIRQLIQENRKEPTTPVLEPMLNKGQPEEEGYSRNVESSRVRKDDTKKEVDRYGCKYGDFIGIPTTKYFWRTKNQHQ